MPRQIFQYHPTIGYTFIPSLKARAVSADGAYRICVNGQGFRSDREFIAQKNNKFRVLLFGNSFTAGDGVSNEDRYSDRLERRFSDLEVYNYGISGTGPDQQYLIFLEYARSIEHDLLIIALMVENIRRVGFRYRLYASDQGELLAYAKPYYELQDGALLLKNIPVVKKPFRIDEIAEEERQYIQPDGRLTLFQDHLRDDVKRKLAASATRFPLIAEYDRADHPSWLLMKAILMHWIGQCPARVLLMPIPFYPFVEGESDPTNYRKRFRELAEESGCALHDPLDYFLAFPTEKRRQFRFANDFHLSPAGHAALAESLAQQILEKGWLT